MEECLILRTIKGREAKEIALVTKERSRVHVEEMSSSRDYQHVGQFTKLKI